MTPLELAQYEIQQLKSRLEDAEDALAEAMRELRGQRDAMQYDYIRAAYNFTPTETRFVEAFYARDRVLSVWMLMDLLYGERGADHEPETKIVQVFICKIRRKMGFDAIRNVWGRGYELTESGRAALTARIEAIKARRVAA